MLSGCGHMKKHPWLYASNTSIAIDWLQTKEIARNPNYYEKNEILGKYPSQNEVDLYFLGCLTGNTLLYYLIPEPWNKWFVVGVTVSQSKTIFDNHSIGIRIRF